MSNGKKDEDLQDSNEALVSLIEKLNERIDRLEKKLESYEWPWTNRKKKKCPHCNGTGKINSRDNPYDPYPYPRWDGPQHYIPRE